MMAGASVAGVSGAQQEVDFGELIIGELSDKRYLELPGLTIPLPQWDPVQIGPLLVDFSPTKYSIFLVVAAVLTALLLIWTGRKTRAAGRDRAPRGLAGVMEAAVLFVRDRVVIANIGKGGERYAPFIVTLFFFIAISNLLGLLPWMASATSSLTVTATLALMSLVMIEVAGVQALGWKGYSRTIFFWPRDMPLPLRVPMFVIMTPVEILGKLAKPFALAVRLFANMSAGKAVVVALVALAIMAGPVAGFVVPVLAPVLMAVAITALKLFISLLQAFIFALLTSVFIGLIRHAH